MSAVRTALLLAAAGATAALAGCTSCAGCGRKLRVTVPPRAAVAATTSGDVAAASSEAPVAAPAPDPERAAAGAGPYRGPEVLADPAAAGIGAPVGTVAFEDLEGRPRTLAALLEGAPALVVVYTALGCPVTRLYAPGLRALAEDCAVRGVRFLVVDAVPQDDPAALRARAAALGWSFPLTRDGERALTRALGARRTADCFVVDGAGVLRYRGALDDQYGIAYRLPAPRRRLLLEALAAVLGGREVPVPATEAPGCLLGPGRSDE